MQSKPRATPTAPAPATSPFIRTVFATPNTADFRIGDRVTLDSRGMGRVFQVTDSYVVVDFGADGRIAVAPGTWGFSRL